MFKEIKARLQKLVADRNYYFLQTTRVDAERYLDRRRVFKGMPEQEVAALEQKLNYRFPSDFRAYLLHFGHNCGELFCLGQDLVPAELAKYQEYGRELLADNELADVLNESSFFFELHQGYACSYFQQDERGAISVYQYVEGDDAPVKRFETFTQMLEAEVHKLEQVHQQLKNSDGHFVIIQDGFVQMNYPARNSGMIPKIIGDQFLD